MDFRSLLTLIQVAESNSFTRAGEKMGYSQPTVSFQIKQLEQELGVQLFERIGHTVSLTSEGREVLSYAQKICHLSQEMMQRREGEREARGIIRLAMADSLCSPLIVGEFAKFRAEYPGVSLQVTTAGTNALFRLLDHNEADVVCTLDHHIYNTTYIIYDEEKVGVHVICSARNPLAQKQIVTLLDLLAHPFLLTEKGMSYRRLLDEHLARHSLEIHPILEMSNTDLLCELVEKDVGLSFLPDYVTERAVREKRVVRLTLEGFDVELWKQLLYHRDKWVSAPMQAILTYMSKVSLG